MCGKRRYATAPSAWRAAKRIGRYRRNPHRQQQSVEYPHRAYRCPVCHDWHLTSKVKDDL